ncbi:mediator of RNA polymerase II transcription subunit 15-like [Tropilaelaps mercedesae]|uniref:Mediator of RNA polymerase II transcription subunit 15 n=1 Tax=Tropilaelaps mercedesae TaxID=418985 RepID=A0A1V9X6H8_9ACAR|nr:mediator of RNA polymerase II transcription subunit 15-like [Tropilaelaps mercedesae]
MSAPMNDDSWKTPAFRQNVRSKIEEAIRNSPNQQYKNAAEMENHVFNRSVTKDQYLSFVARLIIHVNPKKNPGAAGGGQVPGAGGPGGVGHGGPPGGPDPMMALRTMTNQQQGPPPMGVPMGASQMSGPNDGLIPPQAQPNNPQQPNGTGGLNPMAMQTPRPMMINQGNPMNPMMMGQQMGGAVRTPGQTNVGGVGPPVQGMMVMGGPPPAKMRPQLTSQQPPNTMVNNQGAVQSPMGASMANQMTPSPAAYAHSPSPVSVGGQGGYLRGGQVGAPSPGSALNTPIGSVASPAGQHPQQHPQQQQQQQQQQQHAGGHSVGPAAVSGRSAAEEQVYLDKLKQLSKYIEPLRRMISRIDKDEDRQKDLSKMSTLLDILSDSNRRCSMDVLLKCEGVLERMDFGLCVPRDHIGHVPSVTSMARLQNDNLWQPLLDAINANIKSPMFNHTLQRVFGQPITMLTGAAYLSTPPSPPSSPPPKRRRPAPGPDDVAEIPDVLQGEIAHLDQRFKVQLDPVQHSGCRTVNLICQLDDKTLPCVPPISVTVPENYPEYPPRCNANRAQYASTSFLSDVLDSLTLHLEKMPSQYSITSLLDTWEMCVRQMCTSTGSRSTGGAASPVEKAHRQKVLTC